MKLCRIFCLKDFLQSVDVAEQDSAPLDFDKALGGEFLEHSCHHLAGRIHVAGDFFLRFLDFVFAGAFKSRNQVRGQALVEPQK